MTAAAFHASGRRYIGVLAADAARRLQRLVQPFGCTIETCRPEVLLETLNGPTHIRVIVDPGQLDASQLDLAIARLRQLPRPAVVYAQRSPENVSRALSIATETGATVVFQSTGEDTAPLVHTIVSLAPRTDVASLLVQIQVALDRLPHDLQQSITGMLVGGVPESPRSLARRSRYSRRTLDRWLARAGIASARLLVVTPWMLRAFRLLQETDLPLRTVATVSEMRTPSRLRDTAIDLVGLTPKQIRVGTTSMTALIDASARALCRGGDSRTANVRPKS